MRRVIHDPEFEADYINSDIIDEYDYYGMELSLGEKMSVMYEQFMEYKEKKIEDGQDQLDYTFAFLRDLRDLLHDAEDDAEYSDDEFFYRESVYLMFKALIFPVCIEFLKTNQSFAQLCKWKAVEILEMIDEVEDSIWENAKNAVVDFLYIDEVKDL